MHCKYFCCWQFQAFFCQKLTLSKTFASNAYSKYLFLCCPNICTLFLYTIFISYILDWTVDHGPEPWTVDCGPWTEDSGPWTVDLRLRTVDPDQRTQHSEQRSKDQGYNWELTTKNQGLWIKAKHGWTFILYLNIGILRYMWYYWWQRWHSAPCPEGFSPGTPVSLTLEKPLFSNSNLTKFNEIGSNLTKMATI